MKIVHGQSHYLFNRHHYNWQPTVYDENKAMDYVLGRAAKEYAALLRIFHEIKKRDPDFKPQSFFDFGSGVGTGTWAAAEHWRSSLFEYFLVDQSRHMNDLAELILRDGHENKPMSLKSVFFRQFLPESSEVRLDGMRSMYSGEFRNKCPQCDQWIFVKCHITVQVASGDKRIHADGIAGRRDAHEKAADALEQM